MAKHTGELRRAQGCGDWLSCGEVCGEVREVREPTAGGAGGAGGAGDRVAGASCGEVHNHGETGIAVGVVVTEARLVVGTWIRAVKRMGTLHREKGRE